MNADVSTTTRISNRLEIANKFLGGLLEDVHVMLPAQGNEFRPWHSGQFRSHTA